MATLEITFTMIEPDLIPDSVLCQYPCSPYAFDLGRKRETQMFEVLANAIVFTNETKLQYAGPASASTATGIRWTREQVFGNMPSR